MVRLWAAGLVVVLSLMAGEALADPPEGKRPDLLPGVWYQSEPIGPDDVAMPRASSRRADPADTVDDADPLVLTSQQTPELPTANPKQPPDPKPDATPPAQAQPMLPPPAPPKPTQSVPAPQLPEVLPSAPVKPTDVILVREHKQSGPLLYASGEYLLWWIRDSHDPVLATTGQFHLEPRSGGGGVLGKSDTVVLLGGDVDNEERSGGRFTVGGFLPQSKLGWEASGFFLGERSTDFQRSSGNSVLARPFFNLATGQEDVQTTALPGISTGTLTIQSPSKLWGIDANLQCLLCGDCWHTVRLLGGFRYLNLQEALDVREDIALGPDVSRFFGPQFAFENNAQATVLDSFETRNQFYGGQVGLATQWRLGTWTLDLFGKVGLGATQQRVTIDGSQTIDSPLIGRRDFRGGLLALSSNIGSYERTVFSVVPEAGVTMGKQFGSHVRVFAGYNFLFWSNVVRPSDQIDRGLNPTLIPNFLTPGTQPNPAFGQRPAFSFNETNFWAQGLTFGMELRF
jgi:hypothetical protein